MNKEELRELAEWGARRKVADIERTLSTLQREFPHIFVTTERPVLLKAELRERSENGHGGARYSYKKSTAASAAWTPERRAAQAATMRKRQAKMQAGRKKNGLSTATGRDWKNKWYQRLKAHGPERLVDTAKVLGLKHSSSLVTSSQGYLKSRVIVKIKDGRYQVGPTAPPTN